MTTDYYSTTAYNSTNKRPQAVLDRPDMNLAEKTIRKHPLSIEASQCREYLGRSSSLSFIMQMKNMNQSKLTELLDLNLHEYFQWATSKNKAVMVESIVGVAAYFWIVAAIFATPILGLVGGFNLIWLNVTIFFVGVPLFIWLLGKYALKHGWVKNENNIMFNRRTGLITFPWHDEMVSLPFDEFDAYASASTTVAASTNMFLRLAHRYSDKNIVCPSSFSQSWSLNAEWEEIQHFMDISKPLPDIPTYDFARENDPVSAAYDKKYNRPRDYWKNCDLKKFQEMELASIKAGETFPWGQTRAQAIQSGWKSSGFGEGDWREPNKDDAA